MAGMRDSTGSGLNITLGAGMAGELLRQGSMGKGGANSLQRPPSRNSTGSPYTSSAGAGGGVDKSMLPGHNQSSLSAKLEATRAAFRAAQMGKSADSLAGGMGNRPPSGRNFGRPASGIRASDPGPTNRTPGERPRAYNCYLCGQQFGSQSLFIHIAACQKKWIAVESTKPPRERRRMPPPPPEIAAGQLPTGKAADEFNQSMAQYWDQNSLMGCPICGRTFRPEAFEKHQKVCTPDRPGGPLGPGKKTPPPGTGKPAPPSGGGGGMGRGPARAPSARGGGGGGGMMSKPRAYSCYLCGQQYGSTSLFIHIPQCQKKWLMVEASKPQRERRALPPVPDMLHGMEELPTDAAGIDAFNAAMTGYWDKVSLMGCPICGRTFRPDAYEKHTKVCTHDNPGGPLGMPKGGAAAARVASARGKSGPGMGTGPKIGNGGGGGGGGGGNYDSRPRAFVCYLCGQQFGSKSLHIHIPQCYEKWLKVEANKDPKDRREPPPPPAELDDPLPTTPTEIDAFNQRMSEAFNGVSLMKCKHCGRTMRPEALAKHQKMCTADAPMKGGMAAGSGNAAGAGAARAAGYTIPQAPGGGGGASGNGPSEYASDSEYQDLDECANCGRKMRPDALIKHNKVCTPDKPMKSVKSSGPSAGSAAPTSHAPLPPSSPAPHDMDMRPSPPQRPPAGGGAGASGRPNPRPTRPAGIPPPGTQSQSTPEVDHDEPQVPAGEYNLPDQYDDNDGGGGEDEGGRIECSTCGRRFVPDALEKHSRVCAKVFATKRKPFNMAKQRLQGTEAVSYNRPGKSSSSPPKHTASASSGGAGVPKWKAQSEGLRAAMQNMRQVKQALANGEDIRNIPVQYSAPDPSFIQCPHCGRRFNQKAAERHIPSCANTSARPKFLKAGTGGSGQGAPQSKQLPKW